jgi:hypothetical protein
MTPQSSFMVVAPLDVNRIAGLRSLLATMNSAPGTADPNNAIIPFGKLEALHFARIVVLEDQTLDDITTAYGLGRRDYPTCLAFLADFDGDADSFRHELIALCGEGLRKIFSFCVDFPAGANLFGWMKQREHPASTMYVNWVGRGMQQIREEDALRQALESHLLQRSNSAPEATWRAAKEFVSRQVSSGGLKLTPLAKAPLSLRLKNLAHLIFVPLVLLIFIAARSWLASAHFTSARPLTPPPASALQVAFSFEGLEALGVPPEVLAGFSPEFRSGMSGEESRSRRLGDIGANDPVLWRWGGRDRAPHLAVMMYGKEGFMAQCEAEFKEPHWDVAFETLERLPTSYLGDVEPFGFVDGVGQPSIDWEGKRNVAGDQFEFSNLVSLGEFLLGYSNEYGERLSPQDALQPGPPDEAERGLNFICLNSNIARQFEFVQGAWLMSTKFNGLSQESDPLMGNREPVMGCPVTNTFSLPRENGLRQRVDGLPQFVTVRGGAYFFLPSLRA